jgi:hypothetical protein
MIHKKLLFGGEQVSLIFRISMCYTLTAHSYDAASSASLKGLITHKVPRI